MDLQEEFHKLDIQKSFALGIGVAVLYYFLFYNDGSQVQANIEAARQSQKTNQAALQRVRKALEDQKKFEAEIKNITANMKDFQRYFINEVSQNDLIGKVSQLAEQHGLTVNKVEPATTTKEFPKYEEIAVQFRVEGPFHSVMEFISSLTKMEKAIDFNTMKFVNTVKGDFPLVELNTKLVLYTSEGLGGEGGNG